MEANEVLLNEVAALRQTCLDTLKNTAVLAERFDEFDRKLFGNGQPGEIQHNKTAILGLSDRIRTLENAHNRRLGGAETRGALAGGLMWFVGITIQYIWTRLKYGAH